MARISIVTPALGQTNVLTQSTSASSLIAAEEESLRLGAQRAASGYFLAAKGYRSALENVLYAAAFNSNLDKLNTQERLRATARSYDKLLSQQIVNTVASGLSLTSKSSMLLRSEASDAKYKELRLLQQDAMSKQQASKFETNIRVGNLTQQARAAEIAGNEELAKAERRIMENTERQAATDFARTTSLLGRFI